jgi:inhibitor of cysteine peptidase
MASDLTSADNGRIIAVRVGDDVTLLLPDNPSTGFRWAVDADPDFVKIEVGEFIPPSTMVGGGGEAHWSFKAKRPGITKVTLTRWRPWEGERSAIERYEITLQVSA